MFGDELTARPQMMPTFTGTRRELITRTMRTVHRDRTPLARTATMARSAAGGISDFRKWARTHCDMARLLGARMGLTAPVQEALAHPDRAVTTRLLREGRSS